MHPLLRPWKYDREIFQYWVETRWSGEVVDKSIEQHREEAEGDMAAPEIDTAFDDESRDNPEEGQSTAAHLMSEVAWRSCRDSLPLGAWHVCVHLRTPVRCWIELWQRASTRSAAYESWPMSLCPLRTRSPKICTRGWPQTNSGFRVGLGCIGFRVYRVYRV